ncbi:hypothetical protein Glove_63g70 [Diversispora epigaea]|uniref:Uncharacterized protein n=1 Tax=Diversispora epigaea TaxID=1348612 RepID=A0A397JEM9_9GLOM|nr:hypothetical protein Glove_63g70 [Diversispora epigaea]
MKWNLGSNSTPEEIIISSEEEKEEGGVIEKFFINVACGENHCLALTRDGEVFSWGSGRYGQLGHGNLISLDKSDKPKVIEFLQGLKITSIACGAWHSAVISDSGDLYTFGWNNLGRLGISPPPGNNNENNENTVNSAEPSLVEFQGDCNDDFINVVKVACGSAHTVVLTDDNNLLTCGWGKYGQQGQGPGNLSEIYSFTSVIEGKKVIDCYCGRWNTFAIVLE